MHSPDDVCRIGRDVSNQSLLHAWGEGNLPSFALHPIQSFQKPFSSTLMRSNGVIRVPDIEEDLEEDSEGFGSSLRANTELSHCCREGCNFSFTES